MKSHRVLPFVAALFAACTAEAQLPDKIVCEGDYGGHLQGVATDGESIYWSFTVAVVKTDLAGKILASRKAPSHQGDMCYKDGVVYVAVNLGKFNTETRGVSQVTAYDAKTLEPLKTIPLPEMPHGAGGMTWKGDKFYIIGGLPLRHEKNYVYEYTSDFKFVKRHDLDTGFTWMGIQTAAHEDDTFYFGIYGSKGDPSGGRIFLFRGPRSLVPDCIRFLQERSVLVTGVPAAPPPCALPRAAGSGRMPRP